MRKAKLGAAAAILSLAVTACGTGGSDGKPAADGAVGSKIGNCDVPADVAGTGPVKGDVNGTIAFQTTNLKSDFGDFFTPLIQSFEKTHPGVTVNWVDDPGDAQFTTRLVTEAQSCTLPDVVNLNQITADALSKNGFLMNWDVKVPDSSKPFIPSIWNSIKAATGAHNVLPWYWGPSIQTFNTDLAKQAGLDPAGMPTTVMGRMDAAEKVSKATGGKAYGFFANPDYWEHLPNEWVQMKVKVMADDGKSFAFASDPNALAWTQRMAQLYQEGALPKDTLASDDDPSKLYAAGQLLYGSENASFLRYVKQNAPNLYPKTGVAPYTDDALGFAPFSGQLIGVPVTSKHAAAAVAFAQYLTNAENQLAWCKDPKVVIFPSTQASLSDPFFSSPSADDPLGQARKVAAAEAAKSVYVPDPFSDAETKAIAGEIQLAMQGKESAATALKNAQDKADKILQNAS
ncbi:MAG: extracellular solute-binding protein [Catenulispora sp.]